jgi:hypothetical protein
MKRVILFLSVIVVILCSCRPNTIDKKQSVNPILGDISFIHKFGYLPDSTTDEDLRIKTHFEYVENLLRQKETPDLSPTLRQTRKQLLDLLHIYQLTGIFPRNYDYKTNRKPCFIDKENRICAVGYLIEKTAGREVAEDINRRHKYETIFAMNDEIVDTWIEMSGLSKEEVAMIQPTYGFPPAYSPYADNHITPAYGISSSALGGINLSLNTLNGIQISRGTKNNTVAIAGLITGAGQTILGASSFPKTTTDFNGNSTKEGKKTLSMVNVGIGTTTMILSAWNLITNRKPKETKMTLSLNTFEARDNNIGMAFTLKRKL